MNSNLKKSYATPQLTIHGNMEKITQQNGTFATDVPQGTVNTGPGSVTGDPTS